MLQAVRRRWFRGGWESTSACTLTCREEAVMPVPEHADERTLIAFACELKPRSRRVSAHDKQSRMILRRSCQCVADVAICLPGCAIAAALDQRVAASRQRGDQSLHLIAAVLLSRIITTTSYYSSWTHPSEHEGNIPRLVDVPRRARDVTSWV